MTLTRNQKIYIGIGGALLVAGVGYYLYTRKPVAKLETPTADKPAGTETKPAGVDIKKPFTQGDADSLVSKILSEAKNGVVSETGQNWLKQLKEAGYVISNGKAVKQTANNQMIGYTK